MKRNVIAAMVFAASATLSAAAYAQDAHNHHGAPKAGPDAAQGHDAHCCKPDPNDTKSMPGMTGMADHNHMQASKKPAAKKPAGKPATDAASTAK